MEHIEEILRELAEIEKTAVGLSTGDEDNINLKTYALREETIKKMGWIVEGIAKLSAGASCAVAAIERMKMRQQVETTALAAAVGARGWSRVHRRRIHSSPLTLAELDSKYGRVKISETVFICAVMVSTFDAVKTDGELYYVTTCGHFAVRISGILFHGNIGNIFTDEKTPEKIKECRFANECTKKGKCDYYHDPLKYTGSQDCRNFIASSWLYHGADPKKRNRGRRFGSRASIDADIIGLQDDEIGRFRDQVMHDILCVFALASVYNLGE